MSSFLIHAAFDVLAWLAAGAAALWVARSGRVSFPIPEPLRLTYFAVLLLGAGLGAYLFGTANLWLSGQSGVARSIEGAVAVGVIAVELYKYLAGIRRRTGARFALPFAVGVAVGRIGCFLSGIDDFTHGTPTALPWAHDFGDGILRHPVQLYETAAMALFATIYVVQVVKGDRFWIAYGFYLVVGYYGAQRFVWEFFKPYGPLLGPFTLFHVLSAALLAYAVVMMATAPKPSGLSDERAFA
ncbi:MAG: prolipoprotein diacylglyceryl transferase family protein [Xanthobacteraceae bacterium]